MVGSVGVLEPFHTLGLGGLGYRSGKASEMEDEVVVILRPRRDMESFVEDDT